MFESQYETLDRNVMEHPLFNVSTESPYMEGISGVVTTKADPNKPNPLPSTKTCYGGVVYQSFEVREAGFFREIGEITGIEVGELLSFHTKRHLDLIEQNIPKSNSTIPDEEKDKMYFKAVQAIRKIVAMYWSNERLGEEPVDREEIMGPTIMEFAKHLRKKAREGYFDEKGTEIVTHYSYQLRKMVLKERLNRKGKKLYLKPKWDLGNL